jgi:hypothetical protein
MIISFEADYYSSTVLEGFRVASTVGFPVPGGWRAACHNQRILPAGGLNSKLKTKNSKLSEASPKPHAPGPFGTL